VALTDQQVQAFVTDGFVRLDDGFSAEEGVRCQDELWAATGYDRSDSSTWSSTRVRLDGFATAPFPRAATTPALHEAFDQIVGPGGWVPRDGLGTFPLRFPGEGEAKEAGWHLEGSFVGPDASMRVTLRSRGRTADALPVLRDRPGRCSNPGTGRVPSFADVDCEHCMTATGRSLTVFKPVHHGTSRRSRRR
jgi:hypothetical protein